MGLVWRCSQAGNFISGDIKPPESAISDEDWIKVITNDENSLYQYSSGNFIWTFYVTTWSLILPTCLCIFYPYTRDTLL